MINIFKQIKGIVTDLRLNPFNTEDIMEYKLRMIEDICTKSIIAINEKENGNN